MKNKTNMSKLNNSCDEDIRFIYKNLRRLINPLNMCDMCLHEWTNFTAKEEKLCEQCYGEKYGKTKVG